MISIAWTQNLTLTITSGRFYSTVDPKFSMCMIPKVASTSLSSFLVEAHQKGNKKNYGDTSGYYKLIVGLSIKVSCRIK